MDELIAIGNRLRAKRKERNLTQAKVAEMLELSTSFYGHIERGTRCPSFLTFLKICKCLEINAEYLSFGDADREGI